MMFDDNAAPRQIVVNLKRLRMRDIAKLEENKSDTGNVGNFMTIIPIIARVCDMTEDEVWDLDFETMMRVQNELNAAMEDVLKKTSGGS